MMALLMQFLAAATVSALIVLSSPFMGQLQSVLRRSLSTRAYVLLFGVGVLVAIGIAVFAAFVRIRERRLQRLGLMVAAVCCAGLYVWANATPYAEVNAVERVHLVEYGLVAFLFYRARLRQGSGAPRPANDARLRQGSGGGGPANDVSLVLIPLLLAFTVGACDEWLQWFIPVRVGEAHDVFMNLAAIGCGVMFGFAVQPPATFAWSLSADSLRAVSVVAAIAWGVFGVFIGQVHLGHANVVPGIGQFRSHYTLDQLSALQDDRADRWRVEPPRALRRLSAEDQYLDEGIWHIRARNTSEPFAAWHENLILERYFAPVLDIPTYAAPAPNRWSEEQRRQVDAAVANREAGFESGAEPYPIVVWPHRSYWMAVAAVAIAVLAMPMLFARRVDRSQQRLHARVDLVDDSANR